MEVIKLGDRITIPGKNVKGEIAFVGETNFAAGIWYGIILDDPIGKHNGTVEGKCYFKCPKNHGIFLKASYIEREHVDIKRALDRRRSLIPKLINYSKYPKTDFKQKPEVSKRKIKSQLQNENCAILGGDMTNTNAQNTKSTTVTECSYNKSAVVGEKVSFVRKDTNHLKTSSKVPESHFYSNKSINKSNHEHVENNDKNWILLTTKSSSKPHPIDNKYPERIIYPNYLKASSKLVERNICIANVSDMNCDELKNAREIQASLRCEDKNTSDNLVKYLYHQNTYLKENNSCSTNRNEILKTISSSRKEDHEILKDDHIKDIPGENTEIEAMKSEIENLKRKLKSTEISLQKAFSKNNEAQEEIKYLKYDNECQRKQIKFQKIHLKLLKMIQGKDSKEVDDFDVPKTSKQKKIGEILDNTIKKHGNKYAGTSDENFDLVSSKATISTQRVLQLEEQNRLMMQGLVELRDFLKTQGKSQSIDSKTLNYDSESLFSNRRKRTCSGSFDSPPIPNPETFTTEESEAQLRENLEMLREIAKLNEFLTEKRESVKNWKVKKVTAESLGDSNLTSKCELNNSHHPAVQPTHNSPNKSVIDINIENHVDPLKVEMDFVEFQNSSTVNKSNIQNYQNIDYNSQDFSRITKMKKKINENHIGDGESFESEECIDELSHPEPKDLNYQEGFSLSNTSLVDVYGKDFKCLENSSSREFKVLPDFPLDLQRQSTDMIKQQQNKSSGNRPMTLTKSKRSDRKIDARK